MYHRIYESVCEREARASAAVLKARSAGIDPYASVFVGSGRRPGLVDPVERELPTWMLYDEAGSPDADPARNG